MMSPPQFAFPSSIKTLKKSQTVTIHKYICVMLLPLFVYQRRDNKKLTCLNSNRLVPIFAVLSHYKHMVTSSNSKHNTYLSTDRITKSSSQYIVDFYMYTITIYYIQGAKIHGLKLFDDFLNRGNPHNDQQGLLVPKFSRMPKLHVTQ